MGKSEEYDEEWQEYTRKLCAIMGEIMWCRVCNAKLISEEAAGHLIKYHKKEAKETKKEIRVRIEWERKANNISDTTVKGLV